jgi:hypothetical protein
MSGGPAEPPRSVVCVLTLEGDDLDGWVWGAAGELRRVAGRLELMQALEDLTPAGDADRAGLLESWRGP